jgi:DNA-directed RNA polymerase specialized sigma24 family protein
MNHLVQPLAPKPPHGDAPALVEPARELVARFGDAGLRKRMVGNVRWHGVPERMAEDVVQQTLEKAWKQRHEWPATVVELEKLLFTILMGTRIDATRKDGRAPLLRKDPAARKPGADHAEEGGEPEGVDDPPIGGVTTSPVDARDALRWAVQRAEEKPSMRRALGWLMRNQMGQTLDEIAAADGVTKNVVALAISKLRADMRNAFAALCVLFLIGAFGFAYWKHRKDDSARDNPTPVPTVTAPPAPAPQSPPGPQADDLRRRGLEACDAQRWKECLDDLDQAARLDPDGDGAPRVRLARDVAQRGLEGKHPTP